MKNEIKISRVVSQAEKVAAIALRLKVFGEEQGIDPTLDFDGNDGKFPLFIGMLKNQPVATVRLRPLDEHTGKIERLAVEKQYRGQQLGRSMMLHLMQYMQHTGYAKAVLTAQIHVRKFYEDLGYQVEGEEFTEAGLPHIKMTKVLN